MGTPVAIQGEHMHLRLGLAAVIGLVLFVVFLLGGSPQTPAHAQAGAPARAASDAPLGALSVRAPFTTTTPAVTTPTSTATATPADPGTTATATATVTPLPCGV